MSTKHFGCYSEHFVDFTEEKCKYCKKIQREVTIMVKRDYYLNQLINKMDRYV